MSKQQANQKNQTPSGASVGSEGGLRPEETTRVRELIAGRHSKAALQLAKDLCKRCRTSESEALLVEAYKARIDDLLKLGMTVEAKALVGIVRERFPAAVSRLADVGWEINSLDGRLEEVVGPLSDPNLPAEDRNRIETFIRQRVYDLTALAAASSLPADHSLRTAASALSTAFQAVTQGAAEEKLLALPEVSHRSPLAAWKALVLAIASYYRRQDEECRKWLQAIAGDSVPARLIPSFHAMLGMRMDVKFSPVEQKLIAAAGDRDAALRSALAALEKTWQGKKQKPILAAARVAMAATGHCGAGVRDRLRQHIAIRSLMQEVPLAATHDAMGGAPRRDAYFYRLLSLALEERHVVENSADAVLLWEDFRREAIRENWFAAGDLEDGVLALHAAQIIETIPPYVVEEMRVYGKRHGEKPLPSAGLLYERACNADPHPEAFQNWLKWAKKNGPRQIADHVADRWRKAGTGDTEPLLYLMESAAKRNAYQKSLKYLEEAEELDRLNPAVRRAKLRLLLSAALRHLRQGKAHLVANQIEQLKTIDETHSAEIALLAAGLRWCSAAITQDQRTMQAQEAELMQSMGDVAGHLWIAGMVRSANMGRKIFAPSLKFNDIPAAELLSGAARACLLGERTGISIPLLFGWTPKLIDELSKPDCPLDAEQLSVLGEAALSESADRLAYAVSVAGLGIGAAPARFLFLRARILPHWAAARRDGCFSAALGLARIERDTELAGRILDELSGGRRKQHTRWDFDLDAGGDMEIATLQVSPKLLHAILEEERDLKQLPIYERYCDPQYAAQLEAAGGGDDGGIWDDDEDDFDESGLSPSFEDLTKVLDQVLDELPPELVRKVTKSIAAGADPIDAIDKVLGGNTRGRSMPAPKKKRKVPKAPPPAQDSLF